MTKTLEAIANVENELAFQIHLTGCCNKKAVLSQGIRAMPL